MNSEEEDKEEHLTRSSNSLVGLDIRDLLTVYSMGLRSYLFVDILGTGAYSTVYKAVLTQDRNALFPEEIAIKVIKDQRYREAIKREVAIVDILMKRPHPNIIGFIEQFKSKDNQVNYIVCELALLGDLFDVLQRINHRGQRVWHPLRPKYCRHFIKEIAMGLQHLFLLGISHGDIKLENILVNWCEPTPNTPQDFTISRFMRMVPKLTDFNNSKMDKSGNPIISDVPRCSPVTAAPESMFCETHYDMKMADIYSVGACLLAMLLGCYPFIPSNDTPEDELVIHCTQLKKDINLLNHMINPFDSSLKEVLYRTLDPEPLNRITIEEFLENDWILEIEPMEHQDQSPPT